MKLNLFTKKFWFTNKDDGEKIPYEKCFPLYNQYNPVVVSFANQSKWDSSWHNDNNDYSWESISATSDFETNDYSSDFSSEIKRKRKK